MFNNPIKQMMFQLLSSVDEFGNDIDHLKTHKADKSQVKTLENQFTSLSQSHNAQQRYVEVLDDTKLSKDEADERYEIKEVFDKRFTSVTKLCDKVFTARNPETGNKLKGSKPPQELVSILVKSFPHTNIPPEYSFYQVIERTIQLNRNDDVPDTSALSLF
ncbi:hypothetical protein [Vibrio mediterranei]|uniref:hypothetical protein n=1 Tax=Vibrio mediterranei TaxID=689 RepID=UPI0022847F46|nr:hypothetical protein [Vibrio mediterranei]MCY9853992.1 hypothetical protein [Vibrio mediterranei]